MLQQDPSIICLRFGEALLTSPTYKKGIRKDPGNQPVSLTSAPGETMDKTMPGALERH